MQTPPPLATLPLEELQHAIDHPDPDQWVALSSADLQQIQKRCARHWTVWWMQLHPLRLFGLIALVILVPVIARMPSHDWSDLLWWRGVFVITGMCAVFVTPLLMILMAACFSLFKLDRMTVLAERLRTVPHAEYYSRFSLGTLAQSDSAQAYYDQVQTSGRSRCVVDFEVMLKLAAADRISAAH